MDRFTRHTKRQTGRLWLALGLATALLCSATGWAAPPVNDENETAEAFSIAGPAIEKSAKPVRLTPSETLGIALTAVPEVRLKAVDTEALLREDAQAKREGITKVLRYGIGRDVQLAALDGHWHDLPDGKRLWVAEIASTDALGLRLHFKDVRLPAGSELAVYAPTGSDPVRGVVKSGSPRFDPDRYVEFYEADGPIAKRGGFWTGSVFGDRARIEYLAPAGAAADALPFAVDRLQHLYLDPVAALAKSVVGEKAAGPCHNDVTCFPEWADLARSVSGIGFIGSNSLFCTGQLLNSTKPDFTPFWLTANHCLSDSFEAESAEFFWLYQTATCGGAPPSLASVPRSQGATLLSTNPQSDYSLLIVEGTVPRDLVWAGWTNKAPGDGTDAVAIHHPSGDFKRISFAFKGPLGECSSFFPGRSLVKINWTDAPTEPGSSGSGVFLESTGQLFGQLLGGPSACGNENFDCYGSFATTFTKTKTFLTKGGSDDKSEQNDTCGKARNMKTGTQSGRIVKVLDEDWYKISVKPGKTINIDLGFAHVNGDVDLQAFGACNGEAVAVSDGTTDGEGVSLTNVGTKPATLFWRVFLSNDTRNAYNMVVTIQ